MIRISNTSPNQRFAFTTKGFATPSIPAFIDLGPNQTVTLPRLTMHDWPAAAKQSLAEAVAAGVALAGEVDSVHLYQDKGHQLAYSYDYLLVENSAVGLSRAIEVATDFALKFNQHVNNAGVHTGASVNITAATPTNLATLQAWITDAQIQYPAHIAAGAVHPTVDTWNVLVPILAVDIPTAVRAMQELSFAFTSHKTWLSEASFVTLTVNDILTY